MTATANNARSALVIEVEVRITVGRLHGTLADPELRDLAELRQELEAVLDGEQQQRRGQPVGYGRAGSDDGDDELAGGRRVGPRIDDFPRGPLLGRGLRLVVKQQRLPSVDTGTYADRPAAVAGRIAGRRNRATPGI